jgi:hypothetical protein
MPPVKPERSRAVAEVQAVLATLADTLDEHEKADFKRREQLILQLTVSEADFAAEAFVAQEVANAMPH